MDAAARWADARRVLAVRLDAMGDLLMTTPALHALAGQGRAVTLLTAPDAAALAALVPGVVDVMTAAVPWMKPAENAPEAGADAERALIAAVRARGFDAAVIFTVWSQSALPAAMLCRLADVPLRLAHCRENPYRLLTDWARERDHAHAPRHEVRRQLDLVATIGAAPSDERLRVAVPAAAYGRACALLHASGVRETDAWVAMHPGATAPSRRYPPEHFAAAGRLLARDGRRVVLVGTAGERELAETVRTAIGPAAVSLAGRTDVAELAGVLAAASLLVANNSGPMHLAAAVGTPVVVLYALTNPQHTPWGVPHRALSHDVPCRHCLRSVCPERHHDCLRRVPPAAVVEAVRELLREARPAAADVSG